METSIKATVSMVDMLEQIQAVGHISDILPLIKRIDALKAALDAADTFRAQAVKYAKLEASALIRAVELGGMKDLRGLHGKTAEWLYGLSEHERDKYILMCEDGLTIDQVYKREVGDVYALKQKIENIEWQRDELIKECKENGIVNMERFTSCVRDTFKVENRAIGEDIIDGTRNRLRQAGACGIGDGTGVYVMPRPENDAEVKKAIILRYESLCSDFESIREIARASKIKMSFKELCGNTGWLFHDNSYVIHALLALSRLGIISDSEDLYDAINNEDMRSELEYVTKQLGFSREKYIKIQYEKLFGERSDGSDGGGSDAQTI